MTESREHYGSKSERLFETCWARFSHGAPGPVREYRFHPTRKWRLDFAWPAVRVGVEIQGGTWTRGRHTRGIGYERDCEKLNEAQALGWRVFYLTTSMLEAEPVRWITMIATAVLGLKGDKQ